MTPPWGGCQKACRPDLPKTRAFSMTSILIRWLFAFLLLALTFNPTPYNYVSWVRENYETQMPLAALIGLVLLIGYIIFLRATLRSIGPVGMVLIAALFAAVIWVLIDWGWLTLENRSVNLWLGIVMLSAVLGIGLSWSIIRRRLSGQADVDDVEL